MDLMIPPPVPLSTYISKVRFYFLNLPGPATLLLGRPLSFPRAERCLQLSARHFTRAELASGLRRRPFSGRGHRSLLGRGSLLDQQGSLFLAHTRRLTPAVIDGPEGHSRVTRDNCPPFGPFFDTKVIKLQPDASSSRSLDLCCQKLAF